MENNVSSGGVFSQISLSLTLKIPVLKLKKKLFVNCQNGITPKQTKKEVKKNNDNNLKTSQSRNNHHTMSEAYDWQSSKSQEAEKLKCLH